MMSHKEAHAKNELMHKTYKEEVVDFLREKCKLKEKYRWLAEGIHNQNNKIKAIWILKFVFEFLDRKLMNNFG